ncbi:MAG: CaiB/BaiF CoA transferase family protein [Immundisolibacter sp.]|uniref:CaiB/BaiF CoA transferase family protein n=1 Tax=Immundisolibacter sp. TaxID=1934948 RepID=UPI003EE03738
MEHKDFYRDARPDGAGPLAGLRVLEATNYGAGPFCGMVLADFGAESIKVEAPAGDPIRVLSPFVGGQAGTEHSVWYLSINRNKKGITLDLRQPRGQALFRRLAARADIVVENYTPGAMASWGLGYADLAALKPDLIYVSVSGFGQFGPLSQRKGFDPVAQAMSGLMSVTGEPDGRPLRAGFAFADDLSGWLGAMGAMAALLHRNATGEGQHVDSSLVDSLIYASDMGVMAAANAGHIWQRQGAGAEGAAPLNSYRTEDGRHVFIHGVFDKAWAALCAAMERGDLITDPRTATVGARGEHKTLVDEVVASYAASHSVEEIVERAERSGFVASPILDFAQVGQEPHFRQRASVAEVDHPVHGALTLQGVSPKFSRTPAGVRHAAPTLGQHNAEIYGSLLGLDSATLQTLHADGII